MYLKKLFNSAVLDETRVLTKSFFQLTAFSQGVPLVIFIKDCNLKLLSQAVSSSQSEEQHHKKNSSLQCEKE